MTKPEFNYHATKLKKQWPRAMSPERLALIWDMVQHDAAVAFGAVVKQMLLQRGVPPTPTAISEAMATHRQTAKVVATREWRKSPEGQAYRCPGREPCDNGVVFHGNGVMACFCRLGELLDAFIQRVPAPSGQGPAMRQAAGG